MQPLCLYFVECGGCSLQHLEYQIQLENKKKFLQSIINFSEIKVFSDKEYFYRNRMDMIFHPVGIGFRKKGKWHKIVDVEKCVISDEKLNLLIKEVRNFFKNIDFFDIYKKTGTFKYAVIRTPQNVSSISFVLNEDSTKTGEAIEKIKLFSEISTANNIVITYVSKDNDESISQEYFVVKGGDMLKEAYLGKTFYYSVQGFFQNNTIMAEKMHNYVNELLKQHQTKDKHLLDLYAVVGTFGIINADLFKEVLIVESFQACIDAANKNLEINNIKNAKTFCLEAKNIKKLSIPESLFVISDPPRSGMEEKTIQILNELKPELIIYISCNPEQLGKDLPKFRNYKIKSAALFDLFPQTSHSEAVIELVRK